MNRFVSARGLTSGATPLSSSLIRAGQPVRTAEGGHLPAGQPARRPLPAELGGGAGTRAGDVSFPIETAVDFDAIYDEHFAFVWRCLRHLGVAPAALDDAAQDVFVIVHRRIGSFAGAASLRTWIYGIVRRVASKYRRSADRRAHLEPLEHDPPCRAPGPFERAQEAEAIECVYAFVQRLDEKKRDVFILGVLEEFSVPEIATVLSVPVNTAYTRLRRVRAAFRTALAKRR